MLFCGTNGVTAFFPERVQDNPYVPPVVITSLKILNKHVPIGGPVLKQAIPYVNSLALSYRHSVFSFEFAALSYANSQKNRYRYKLENFDPGWNEVDSNHSLATYTNLDPGKYIFRVQGSNSDGIWNQEGTALNILITPPWWNSTWFRALCVICFGMLLWGGLHVRVRQLREQEKKFREAVETMPALAFVNEPNGGRTFVNKAWLEYTGLSRQQAAGSGWEKAIHPDDLKRVVQRWRTSAEAGQLLEYEVRVRRGSDGAYRWFQTRARPVYDKRGKIAKWCAVSIDIEDRKRAEQLQAELAHVSRVSTMGELAASISHELNQPIAASIMNASLALEFLGRNPPDLTQVRERTTKTIEMGTLASEIIDRLRSLYKKEPPKRESIALNQVIGEMVELLRGQAMRHGISVRVDFATNVPNVIADRVQIQQVLMNLMLNGIEAMSDTGGVLTLKSQVLENGHVEISANDTGPGLPPGNVDQIFDAFFTTKPQGSGMGLAISKSIVDSHGGRIWANGDQGRGATFHFTLPPSPSETEISDTAAN
jgi:PAS domain S-box-containing protein